MYLRIEIPSRSCKHKLLETFLPGGLGETDLQEVNDCKKLPTKLHIFLFSSNLASTARYGNT